MANHSLCSWQQEHSLHVHAPSTWGVSQSQWPHHAQVTQGQQGYTHGGKGANLFDVLFITLRAGRPPGCSSGVPEGVIILQGVLSWPWDNSLQNRKACLPLICSSKRRMGKITFTASEVHMFLLLQTITQTDNPHFYRKILSLCIVWNGPLG